VAKKADMKLLSAKELDDIERRFKAGAIADEDIQLLILTARGFLEKQSRETKPKPEATLEAKQTGIILKAPGTDKVEIFTDGACSGNPGPGGWGAMVRIGSVTRELSGGDPHTTNNKMELTAAIEALKCLPEGSTAVLTTDSQYVKNGITSWINTWKKNGWKNAARQPVKNADLWRELDQLNQRHSVQWCWVRGHNGHAENERCDQLARDAIASL
jgi:ribonuclease HI